MRTYYHKGNLTWSILGEWVLEREAWPVVITHATKKNPTAFAACCESDSTWAYEHGIRVPVYAPFYSQLRDRVHYLRTPWHKHFALMKRNWSRAAFASECAADNSGSPRRLREAKRNPGRSPSFCASRQAGQGRAAHWASPRRWKSCPVQAGMQAFYGFVTQQKDLHDLQPHPKYPLFRHLILHNYKGSYCKKRYNWLFCKNAKAFIGISNSNKKCCNFLALANRKSWRNSISRELNTFFFFFFRKDFLQWSDQLETNDWQKKKSHAKVITHNWPSSFLTRFLSPSPVPPWTRVRINRGLPVNSHLYILSSNSRGRVISDAWQPGGLFVTAEGSTPGQY